MTDTPIKVHPLLPRAVLLSNRQRPCRFVWPLFRTIPTDSRQTRWLLTRDWLRACAQPFGRVRAKNSAPECMPFFIAGEAGRRMRPERCDKRGKPTLQRRGRKEGSAHRRREGGEGAPEHLDEPSNGFTPQQRFASQRDGQTGTTDVNPSNSVIV